MIEIIINYDQLDIYGAQGAGGDGHAMATSHLRGLGTETGLLGGRLLDCLVGVEFCGPCLACEQRYHISCNIIYTYSWTESGGKIQKYEPAGIVRQGQRGLLDQLSFDGRWLSGQMFQTDHSIALRRPSRKRTTNDFCWSKTQKNVQSCSEPLGRGFIGFIIL